jgi:hypothetical protein
MKLFALCCLVASAVSGFASTYTYSPTPVDLNDLDHHMAYAWRIDGISLTNQTIVSASLTFSDIRNWNTSTNMLFVHLLDTAKGAGVTSFADSPGSDDQIIDNFAGSKYLSNPLVNGATTANTFLGSKSFTTTPVTYKITFTGAELTALTTYINNGNNIAFGIDPDCHFFNDGITFSFTTQSQTVNQVPETGLTATLFLLGLAGLAVARRSLDT